MVGGPEHDAGDLIRAADRCRETADLAQMLRRLRRRHARRTLDTELTYREMAAKTGWSQAAIGEYFSGRTLPPTDRLDGLVALLGADPVEQAAFATARDRVAEQPRRSRSAKAAPAPRPRQLPAEMGAFVGRGAQLAELDALLAAGGHARTAVISAVFGMAGVGKTALALHWAHRVADRFPDGQLYVNLRGFDPNGQVVDPADALCRFLEALGVPPQRIPVDLDAQAALYRSTVAGKRLLVVLDNAHDTAQVRPLLPGHVSCLVVVTSRNELTGLIAAEGAVPITVDLPTTAEARQMLERRFEARRAATEPEAIKQIITACARLPLALAIVAARAAIHPHLPLAAIAVQLGEARGRLDALSGSDAHTDVRAVFSWSYRTLADDPARIFRLLALHPGPDVSLATVASLAGLAPSDVRPLLADLVRAGLLAEPAPDRYASHDLVRAYALELADEVDSDGERREATHRVLDHYLHTAYMGNRLLEPGREKITLDAARPGVTPQVLADHEQAMAWFATERACLLAAVDHAAATGFDRHTYQLAWALWTFLHRQGHWREQAATQRAAVVAAGRLADPTAQAHAHRLLASAYNGLDRFADAHAELRHALDLFGTAGDQVGQAHTHYNIGKVYERQGSPAKALDHDRRALDLFKAAGHRRGQAHALNAIGWHHALLGDYEQTLASCRESLGLLTELGHRDGQAATWDSLGYAHHHLGDHAMAIVCYQHALRLAREVGHRYGEAGVLSHLGESHQAAGDIEAARDAYEQALDVLRRLDHPDIDEVRAKLAALGS